MGIRTTEGHGRIRGEFAEQLLHHRLTCPVAQALQRGAAVVRTGRGAGRGVRQRWSAGVAARGAGGAVGGQRARGHVKSGQVDYAGGAVGGDDERSAGLVPPSEEDAVLRPGCSSAAGRR
ncbi:hypothetical protein SHKM778_56900 [Streptomyces sp. KM77-8]|uniref:Uncharacterized protein n=1 Tax=Streptomyces haneummycinicus TaxID=3074435 RepID=A0AAT9HPT3_9ACTN